MFEITFQQNGKSYFLDFRKDEPQAKARCPNHLNKFGGDRTYRIRKEGKPWLIGRTIAPRVGDERIEWRENYA